MQTFTIDSNQLEGRFDPYYYQPTFKKTFDLITNTKTVLLDEISLKITDGTHYTPTYVIEGVSFISVKDIKNNRINFTDTKFISVEENETFNKRCKPQVNDILLTKIGTIGNTALVTENYPDFNIFVSVALIRPDTQRVNPAYLAYYLSSEYAQIQYKRALKGIGVPDLHLEEIRKIIVLLPDLAIQDKIVSLLSNAYLQKDMKIKEAKESLDSIDEYVLNEIGIKMPQKNNILAFVVNSNELNKHRIDPYYYQPYFAELESSLLDIDVYKLTDLMSEITGGATPDITGNSYLEKDGIPFLRVQNVTKEGLNLNDVKYIKQEVHEGELKRSQLKKDDIVFTITGRIGSAAVVPDNFIGNINQHSVRLHLKNGIDNKAILPEYVAIYFNTGFGNTVSLRGVTGATRPALDYKAIKSLIIPLPSIEVQERIIQTVKNKIEQVKLLNNQANTVVEEARKQIEAMLLATN